MRVWLAILIVAAAGAAITHVDVDAREPATGANDTSDSLLSRPEVAFARMEKALMNAIKSLEAEVKADVQALRAEVKADVQAVKADVQALKADVQALKADVQALSHTVDDLAASQFTKRQLVAARNAAGERAVVVLATSLKPDAVDLSTGTTVCFKNHTFIVTTAHGLYLNASLGKRHQAVYVEDMMMPWASGFNFSSASTGLASPERDLFVWQLEVGSTRPCYWVSEGVEPDATFGTPLLALGFPTGRAPSVPIDAFDKYYLVLRTAGLSVIKAEALDVYEPDASAGASGRLTMSWHSMPSDSLLEPKVRGSAGHLRSTFQYPTGMSGGPVVNAEGELVGLVQGSCSTSFHCQGIAVPLSVLRRTLALVLAKECPNATTDGDAA